MDTYASGYRGAKLKTSAIWAKQGYKHTLMLHCRTLYMHEATGCSDYLRYRCSEGSCLRYA